MDERERERRMNGREKGEWEQKRQIGWEGGTVGREGGTVGREGGRWETRMARIKVDPAALIPTPIRSTISRNVQGCQPE